MTEAGATVLIVDDDAAFRELVTDILAREGVRLVTAGSAEEALQRVALEPVDVVLTDQRMPGLDGLEVLAEIRSQHPRLPVIVIGTLTPHGAAATLDALALGGGRRRGQPATQEDEDESDGFPWTDAATWSPSGIARDEVHGVSGAGAAVAWPARA